LQSESPVRRRQTEGKREPGAFTLNVEEVMLRTVDLRVRIPGLGTSRGREQGMFLKVVLADCALGDPSSRRPIIGEFLQQHGWRSGFAVENVIDPETHVHQIKREPVRSIEALFCDEAMSSDVVSISTSTEKNDNDS